MPTHTEPCVIEPSQTAEACVIWLHGLGADGYDFVDLVPLVQRNLPLATRFILPHAAVQPITINHYMPARAWFDIFGLDIDSPQDEVGIRSAQVELEQLIEAQHQTGIPYRHIYLIGFSQGGALSLFAGLRHHRRLGGIAGLCAFLPLHQSLQKEIHPENQKTPVFIGYGKQDQIVTPELSTISIDYLQQAGVEADIHSYDMAHSVCPEEIADLHAWLTNAQQK